VFWHSLIQYALAIHPHQCPDRLIGSALPINLFHVTVYLHRQAVASPRPATFEHLAAICGSHARSKTVRAQASANLRLISSFRHTNSIQQEEVSNSSTLSVLSI
jgi:hypothetical protein